MASPVGIIAAASWDGVIAQGGRIPWDEPADRAYFKRRTLGHAVIMGRRTWTSLPIKPLPDRTNLVLTRGELPGVRTFDSLAGALESAPGEAWIIGGARLYAEALAFADTIEITRIPLRLPETKDTLHMPEIPEDLFEPLPSAPLDDRLVVERWRRRP